MSSSKIKRYDLSYKLQAIEKAEKKGNRPTARELNIDERRIREWRAAKDQLKQLASTVSTAEQRKIFRGQGGGRKAQHPEFEQELATWIIEQREQHLPVSRSMIAKKALALRINEPTFKASNGWIDKYLIKWGFSLRRSTTVGQQLPADLSLKIINFVKFCSKQRAKYGLQLSAIGNMDETAVWMDMPSSTTVDLVGAKSVPLKTTGHEKNRVTVCLAAMADGRKLQPMIVFKGKRMPNELKNVTGAVIALSANGWMNEDMTNLWIEKVWGTLAFNQRMLAWDTFRCHVSNTAKLSLAAKRTIMAAIPGGCTKVLQPADVSWNGPFKHAYRQLYDAWMAEGDHERTAAGNLRAPPRDLIVSWVKQAWATVTPEVIQRSFEACGITTDDVNLIHCTKEGGEATEARTALAQWKANGGGDDGPDENANSASDDDGDNNEVDEPTAEDFIDSD
jgi:hypothetical protein